MKRLSLLFVLLAFAFSVLRAAVPELPVETFFKKPEFSNLVLSPNGQYLAALVPVKGRMNIAVIELATMKPYPVTSFDEDINSVTWATNDRLLFTMDFNGNESIGLFSIDKDAKNFRVLAKPAQSQVSNGSFVVRQTHLLSLIEGEPDYILVTNNDRDETIFDVYRMNIRTGVKSRVVTNPGKVGGWVTDHNGVVRFGVEEDGLDIRVIYRSTDKSEWRTLAKFEYGKGEWSPIGFAYDNRTVYIANRLNRDKSAVYTYDPETDTMGDLVFESSEVDVANVQMARCFRRALSVPYYTDRLHYHWLDETAKKLQDVVDAALPNTENSIQYARDNATKAIVVAHNDRDPGSYYLFDIEKQKLTFLLRPMNWIKPEQMAEMKPVTIKARDGMILHGYLTRPVGSEGKPVPLIINPHGGPQARDDWGYNPEVQLMANRGFAVLQVNFRGSTGYGWSFVSAGFREWGRKMQNDLTDSVEWAIAEGITTRGKVGIYGGSYGGYAAMAGLTFTPELYSFGINTVGVVDIGLLLKTMPKTWELARKQMEMMIGSAKTDKAEMDQWSPVNHVEKIRVPLLMAYGELDPRVVLKHAQLLEKQLKKHGKTYQYILFDDEGHGWRKQENRYKFYKAFDEFLKPYRN